MALLESGKRLTADEEVIVFRYYHEHTTPEMRNQIALNNLGLVHSVINNYTYSGIPAEDLPVPGPPVRILTPLVSKSLLKAFRCCLP